MIAGFWNKILNSFISHLSHLEIINTNIIPGKNNTHSFSTHRAYTHRRNVFLLHTTKIQRVSVLKFSPFFLLALIYHIMCVCLYVILKNLTIWLCLKKKKLFIHFCNVYSTTWIIFNQIIQL